MRGLPKFFNTKQDYLNCLAIEELKEATKKELQKLIDNRFSWFDVAVIDGVGIEDETHRVVEDMQQELREDPNARIFQIGFTVQEIEELLK